MITEILYNLLTSFLQPEKVNLYLNSDFNSDLLPNHSHLLMFHILIKKR